MTFLDILNQWEFYCARKLLLINISTNFCKHKIINNSLYLVKTYIAITLHLLRYTVFGLCCTLITLSCSTRYKNFSFLPFNLRNIRCTNLMYFMLNFCRYSWKTFQIVENMLKKTYFSLFSLVLHLCVVITFF